MKKSVWKNCTLKKGVTYTVLKPISSKKFELNKNDMVEFVETTQNLSSGITNYKFLDKQQQELLIEISDSVSCNGLEHLFEQSSEPIKKKNKSNLIMLLFFVAILGLLIKFVVMFPTLKSGFVENPLLCLLGVVAGVLLYKFKNIKR